MNDTYHVKNVAHLMAIAYTQMGTLFVLYVTPGKAEITMFKNNNPMYTEWNHEDSHDDFLNEVFPRKSVKNTESTSMETNYASIIEAALDRLLA